MVKISTNSAFLVILLTIIIGCESSANVKISCKKTNKNIEFVIRNQSNHNIYYSDLIEFDIWGDSLVIQPKITRPRDEWYNKIQYYAFIPPEFRTISPNKSITVCVKCDVKDLNNVFFRIFDSDFSWTPSKKEPSHELFYFKHEKNHSKLYYVSK